MRFLVTSPERIDLDSIAAVLICEAGIQVITSSTGDSIDIYSDDQMIAQISVDRADADILVDDVSEFRDMVGPADEEAERIILLCLDRVECMVVAEAFWKGGDPDPSLRHLDRLWSWLFSHFEGLLQVDGEGFYSADGLLLARHFTL